MEEIVLSIDKMNYLKKLGISNMSASAIWIAEYLNNEFYGYSLDFLDIHKKYKEDDVPTFTIDDLIKMLPSPWQLNSCTSGYELKVIIVGTPNTYHRVIGVLPIEAIYNMICLLRRKKCI